MDGEKVHMLALLWPIEMFKIVSRGQKPNGLRGIVSTQSSTSLIQINHRRYYLPVIPP